MSLEITKSAPPEGLNEWQQRAFGNAERAADRGKVGVAWLKTEANGKPLPVSRFAASIFGLFNMRVLFVAPKPGQALNF